MTKQKIVIRVQLKCQKCRSKAMQIAAVADGVESVSLQGSDRDEIVVIGAGVDAPDLTSALRKKVGQHASLVSVEQVKPKEPEKKKKKEPCPVAWTQSYCYQPQPQLQLYRVVCDPPPSACTVM